MNNSNNIINDLKERVIYLENELKIIKNLLSKEKITLNKNICNYNTSNETIIQLKNLSSCLIKYPLEELNISYLIRKKCEIKNINHIFNNYQFNICIVDDKTTDIIFINENVNNYIRNLIYTPNKNSNIKINIKDGLGKKLKNNYHSDFYVHKNYQQEKYRDSNFDFDNQTFLNPKHYCTNCKFICECGDDIDKYECLGH